MFRDQVSPGTIIPLITISKDVNEVSVSIALQLYYGMLECFQQVSFFQTRRFLFNSKRFDDTFRLLPHGYCLIDLLFQCCLILRLLYATKKGLLA